MPTAKMTISIDVEETVKERFDEITEELGIGTAAAFRAFVSAVVRGEGLPFAMTLRSSKEIEDELEEARFYSEPNMRFIQESYEAARRGERVSFDSIEELETIARTRA